MHRGSPGRGEWLDNTRPAENQKQAKMGVNGGSCPWYPSLPCVPRGHSQLPSAPEMSPMSANGNDVAKPIQQTAIPFNAKAGCFGVLQLTRKLHPGVSN